jgi:putative glutamine amidotransferase
MPVRIAIPEPSRDQEYNGRALPHYLQALKAAGAEPLVVALSEPREGVAKLLESVQGVLLPGSRFDVDPARYGEARQPECGEDDPARTAADELLLQNAFDRRMPLLAICHGTQTLNVWRSGSLIQDLKTAVNHRPGRDVVDAHPVEIVQASRLKAILNKAGEPEAHVNSSHHQAIRNPGDRLRVSALSPGDGVVEAVELDSPDHFVLGVQWHPERTYAQSAFSRAIFGEFVRIAGEWQPPQVDRPANGR